MELVTRDQLVTWSQGQVQADEAAQLTVDAVNSWATTLPVVARLPRDELGELVDPVPQHLVLGCLMLANRTHRRRQSPNGIASITGETVAYVARHDPEVSRYLELDRPSIG